jgi:hypothetical protein
VNGIVSGGLTMTMQIKGTRQMARTKQAGDTQLIVLILV